jgi:hypothetical protein
VPWRECMSMDYAEGPYCWFLDKVRAFREPIRWKGKLGLFHVPNELVADALLELRHEGQRQAQVQAWASTGRQARMEVVKGESAEVNTRPQKERVFPAFSHLLKSLPGASAWTSTPLKLR